MYPLDWTYSCGDFYMQLFIGRDSSGQEKIFVKATRIPEASPVADQEVLYEREVGLLNPEIIRGVDRGEWEAKQLRWFTDTHPDLTELEKAYFVEWCKRNKQ